MNSPLLEKILARPWFYEFDLPNGQTTPCRAPDHVKPIHTTRLAMLWSAVDRYLQRTHGAPSTMRALDIASHQGYFSYHLAQKGFKEVLGIDARAEHISDASLIRDAYQLANLHFAQHDINTLQPTQLGKFEVVLCYGLLYHVENPIGLLRLCRNLCQGVCIIETQVVPNVQGMVDWGSYEYVRPLQGVFGLIDETTETHAPEASTTGICMAPSLEGLIWIMQKLGFREVIRIAPPADAYEQHRWGKRVVVAGYL